MARKPSSFLKQIRDQIFYSGVVIIVIFMVLKMIGLKIGIQGLILSIILTVALNVGLSYLPRRGQQPPPPPRREPGRRANTGMMHKLKTGAIPVVKDRRNTGSHPVVDANRGADGTYRTESDHSRYRDGYPAQDEYRASADYAGDDYSAADAAAEDARARETSERYHRQNKTLWED